jgi:endoglucanase
MVATAFVATPAVAQDDPVEQLVNGSFDSGKDPWFSAGTTSDSVVAGTLCAVVPGGTVNPWDVIIGLNDVEIVAGEEYRFSFTASASASLNVRALVGNSNPPYQVLAETNPLIGPAASTTTLDFVAGESLATGQVAFQIGGKSATPWTFCLEVVSLLGGVEAEPYEPDTGPRVRVNQVGYLAEGPKEATLVTEETGRLHWQLHDAAGAVVATGRTTPAGVDPTSDLNVHTIGFDNLDATGFGYRLVSDGETSHPFAIGVDAVYEQLRDDAMTVYYTNRSGIAIDDAIVPGYGRAAGHVGVAPNQGDTAVACMAPGDPGQGLYAATWTCPAGYALDVTGGWYDAGDHGKYVVNGGISAAQLMQTYERSLTAPSADPGALADGTLRLPESANGVPDILDEVRWELEWMLKMQVPAGSGPQGIDGVPVDVSGMAHHKISDVDWTGLPLAPANDAQPRHLFRPSTAATLNLAAAAAQGARLFEPFDGAFAAELLAAAEIAYAAALDHPAILAPPPGGADTNPGSGPYNDDDVIDEFYWAAAELYLTTGGAGYLADIEASPLHGADAEVFTAAGFDWGHVAPLAVLDLATVTSDFRDRDHMVGSIVDAADMYLKHQRPQPWGQAYAPEDGNYVWGSNSQILNNLQVIATAYDLTGRQRYADAVARSMDYILGRNALNISYVTGYGDVYAENQHSRMYADQVDVNLPNPPDGTLSGGPNSTAVSTGDPVAAQFLTGCLHQWCYIDDIGSWSTNELTINWNAPTVWVANFMADLDDGAD